MIILAEFSPVGICFPSSWLFYLEKGDYKSARREANGTMLYKLVLGKQSRTSEVGWREIKGSISPIYGLQGNKVMGSRQY